MDIHGYPWLSMGIHGYHGYAYHGYPWISMVSVDIHGYPWIPMDVCGYSWISMAIHGDANLVVFQVWDALPHPGIAKYAVGLLYLMIGAMGHEMWGY